jgi:hypothetical protein
MRKFLRYAGQRKRLVHWLCPANMDMGSRVECGHSPLAHNVEMFTTDGFDSPIDANGGEHGTRMRCALLAAACSSLLNRGVERASSGAWRGFCAIRFGCGPAVERHSWPLAPEQARHPIAFASFLRFCSGRISGQFGFASWHIDCITL